MKETKYDEIIELTRAGELDKAQSVLATLREEVSALRELADELTETDEGHFLGESMEVELTVAKLDASATGVDARLEALEKALGERANAEGELRARLSALEGAIQTSGGDLTLRANGTLRLEGARIEIESASEVDAVASKVSLAAGMLDCDAGMAKFSGVVQSDSVITNAVVSATYTPGAGNIW